jgi:hypothetical protein
MIMRVHRRTMSIRGGLDLMKFVASVFLLLSLLYPMLSGRGGEWRGKPSVQDAGSKGTQETAEPKITKKTLTDIDIINMVNAGLADTTIVLDIQTSPTAFDTAPQALVFLQRGGVSQTVIDAMLTAASGKPAPPAVTPVPAPVDHAGEEPAKSAPVTDAKIKAPKPNLHKIRKVILEMDWADDETARARAMVSLRKHTCLTVVETLDNADAKLTWTNQGLMGVDLHLYTKDDQELWSKRGFYVPVKALGEALGCD